MVTATKQEAIRRYKEVQDIAIEATIRAIENAKKRRQEIIQLWTDYRAELQKSIQDKILEELGEKDEKKFGAYNSAKGILNRKATPKNVNPALLGKVVEEEKDVRRLLEAMRKDETAEGRAIKEEMELGKREIEELEKVLSALKQSEGRLLTQEKLQELQVLIHNVAATLEREVSVEIYLRNVEAAENRLAANIGSFAHNMSQLEFKEVTAAKK